MSWKTCYVFFAVATIRLRAPVTQKPSYKDTHTSDMPSHTELSPQVERDLVEYRSVSAWAVAAFGLAALSAVAVIGPLLWLFPALALIVSLIALAKIRASQGRLLGRGAALLGLLLAIFFGLAGPARLLSRQHWLETRAEHFAVGFAGLLEQNKPLAAYQLTKFHAQRKPIAADDADPHAKDPDTKKDYDNFLKLEPVMKLLDPDQKAKFETLSASIVGTDDRIDYIEVRYRVQSGADGKSKPFEGKMYVERIPPIGDGDEDWRVVPPAMCGME